MEKLTSFRWFKIPQAPQFVEYGIYVILAILIVLVFINTKKTDSPEGCIVSGYKALVLGLLGNSMLGLIYSCLFALYFIISAPTYEAKVVGSVTHLESIEGKPNNKVNVQYPILELKDSNGKIIQEESNEGILGEPIIGEQATIAYKGGKLITITIFSICIYVIILLIALFTVCVLLYWTILVS